MLPTDHFEILENTHWVRNINDRLDNGWWPQHDLITWEVAYFNTTTGALLSEREYYRHIGIKGMTDEEIKTLCQNKVLQANIAAKDIIKDLLGQRPSLIVTKDGSFTGMIKNHQGTTLIFGYSKPPITE